jgi:lipoate-protein ligase A
VGQEQCFIAPVRNDLLANGRKIAGGAQRRTKRGLLHQGSIQVADIRRDFSTLLASHLACESSPWQPPDELESNTQTLVCKKYTNEEFLARGVLVQDLIHPNIQP